MAKALLFLFVLTLTNFSCNKKQVASEGTYEYFNAHLKPSMTYNDLIATFGNPNGDLGSGIHIYCYNLVDGTSVWIGYTDKIMYARHMSSSNLGTAVLLHTII